MPQYIGAWTHHAWASRKTLLIRLAIAATLGEIAVLALGLDATSYPRFQEFRNVAVTVSVLGNAGAAFVLLQTRYYFPARKAALALGLSWAVSAILGILCLPADHVARPYLYLEWHLQAAVGGIVYVFLRGFEGFHAPSRRFIVGMTLIAIGVTAAYCVVAFHYGHYLPVLVEGSSIRKITTSGFGPAVTATLFVAALLVFRLSSASATENALAVSLLFLSLDIGLLQLTQQRYTVNYYAAHALLMLAGLVTLISALQNLVASRTELASAESRLELLEREARKSAERIRALGELFRSSGVPVGEAAGEMLRIASVCLRPGKPMFARLSRLDGLQVSVHATVTDEDGATNVLSGAASYSQFALEGSIEGVLLTAGGTHAFGDAAREEWRSCIGTSYTVGDQRFFLVFGSPESIVDDPFAEDDIAYVDVVASIFSDVATQRYLYEQEAFSAHHDALTGLPKRSLLHREIREAIEARADFAVALANLDGFRYVNDRDDHETGDRVLSSIADGLRRVSDDDFVARIGGDEFAILIRSGATEDSASSGIAPYAAVFREPQRAGDHRGPYIIAVTASIGVARFPHDGHTVEDLLRRASVALDVAKQRGGSTTVVFDKPMEKILKEAHLHLVELTDAIFGDQLVLDYQPTFDLETRRIVGAEALVRWNHPKRGRIGPGEFVGFAERNGLVGPLTTWVLDQIAFDLATSHDELPNGFRVYFNLAPQLLDNESFIMQLQDLVVERPQLAYQLGIEVTETAAMQNVERALFTIGLFRSWGIAVAIDDFGTGYSSLSYLKQLKVDVVKIDRSFVSDLPNNKEDAALGEMMLRIIDRFGFITLAEGIETEEQARWLTEHGCKLGQGYLVAKPTTFQKLLTYLPKPVQALSS
jgi:diguanylate cyclase (GGDEF)-like protein